MAALSVVVAMIAVSIASVAAAKTYHDPFDPAVNPAVQSLPGSAPNGPSLRVVLAGGSAQSMKELADASNLARKLFNPGPWIDPIDPDHFREELNRVLASKFSRVEYVYWNSTESGSHVDYVLTLEIRTKYGGHSFAENRVDLEGTLARPGEEQKETLAGHGKSKIGYPAFATPFASARQAAIAEFAQNLTNSRLLADGGNTAVAGPVGNATSTAPSPLGGSDPAPSAGLYAVESDIHFNVLDSVYFDPTSGALALIGHHDDRFKGVGIPYLQYLATLLENPSPKFSLAWTADSNARVDAMLARELTQKESDDQASRLGEWFDSSGQITRTGTLMLPALGIYPISENRAPGDLGLEVQSIGNGHVLITKVNPGSSGERAGLQQMDVIASIRPNHLVFSAHEFRRQVRFAGAGASVEVSYRRHGEHETTTATLDAAADTDPWKDVNNFDLQGLLYRGVGDEQAAEVIQSLGIFNNLTVEKEDDSTYAAFIALIHSLDLDSDFQRLHGSDGNASPSADESYKFGLELSGRLDSVFHFSGSPMQGAFAAGAQSGGGTGGGLKSVFREFHRQMVPKVGEMADRYILRPGVGLQMPPELVEDEYHIHPQMTPQYIGLPQGSLLARLMLASDYLGKQLSNRQDLRGKIPGYQTEVEYQVTHPGTGRRASSAERMWISVAAINAAKSADGRMLAIRDARMRFNIRATDSQGNDLPSQQSDGYEDLLTSRYDQLEQEFPTLHELREAAKLAAVAEWMEKGNPGIRLPAEGRGSWRSPDHVDGLIYIYFTVDLRHQSKIIKIAEGGVSLATPDDNNADRFPVDPTVADVRDSLSSSTMFVRPNSDAARTWPVSEGAGPSTYVADWVVPINGGPRGEEAVVLEARSPNAPSRSQVAVGASSNAIPAGPLVPAGERNPIVVSPSQDLQPWTRAAFERELSTLEARRLRAEDELQKVEANKETINEAAAADARIFQELSEDAVCDALDAAKGIFAVVAPEMQVDLKEHIDALLEVASFSAHGMAAARSEPGSERNSKETLDALVSLSGALTVVPPKGVKPEAWEAFRYSVGDMMKVMKPGEEAPNPAESKSRLERLASDMDKMVESAGNLPAVGPVVTGLRSSGQLVDYGYLELLRHRLSHDRDDLQTAGVVSQTARLYWRLRIEEIKAQEAPYLASLGRRTVAN
jgi:hypothetical protein